MHVTTKMFAIIGLGTFAALGSSTAFAAVQNHHCKLADGTMDMQKTHKQCTAAKGKWAKDAAAATPATPAAPAAAPAPAATPAPAAAPKG